MHIPKSVIADAHAAYLAAKAELHPTAPERCYGLVKT
ncbi:hypothetical protein PhiM1_06 [Pectobacterium phage PhiM1]|uniref:Uncharacterized protein n=1 Tax=Pectobacterium phage PhiM1 TaxID=1211386 RepID=A0A1P7WFY9_9CAUD|nr:hypothetical protein FDG64_gp06 [Pectobacterium phage PhiM1]AFQ22491.1 hypothetical protein PhiM1_06 [Pectobacterium phage PhiM1]